MQSESYLPSAPVSSRRKVRSSGFIRSFNGEISVRDTREVQRVFEQLRDTRVNPNRYTGHLQNVVFELIDADTSIAGIASCLLDCEHVDASHVAILRSPLLEETSWLGRDGSRTDLRPYPELLTYAQRVEAVRQECGKLLLPKTTH
jgi:hypothetical protein